MNSTLLALSITFTSIKRSTPDIMLYVYRHSPGGSTMMKQTAWTDSEQLCINNSTS